MGVVDAVLTVERRPLRTRGRKKQESLRDWQLSHGPPSVEIMHRILRSWHGSHALLTTGEPAVRCLLFDCMRWDQCMLREQIKQKVCVSSGKIKTDLRMTGAFIVGDLG